MNLPAPINLIKLTNPSLIGASSLEEFVLHKLALQWSQSEPIVIHDRSDMRSEASWKDRLEPFEHQVQNLLTYCRRLPVSIIADDVGLGKTISAGLILSELMVRQRVNRCLVVCTPLIGPQWIEELQSKFGIEGKFQSGSAVKALFRKDYPVVATTYHSAREYMQEASEAGFDMLILDEAHKLRNLYGTQKPPKMATEIRRALEARVFKYVLMLTATPMQNRIWDLYSLIDCLSVAKGHENPLGGRATFGAIYAQGFKQEGWSATAHGEAFREILRQYLVRTRRATVRLAFPKREIELRRANATNHDRRLMEISAKVVADCYDGSGLIESSLGVAMMSSPQALRKQLYNMSEKKPKLRKYADQVDEVVQQYKTPSKLHTLLQICDELRKANPETWRLVVFTCRIETQNVIVRRMSEYGITVGVIKGASPGENQITVKEYSGDKPKIHVIVSTDAGAEGVNLQAGNVLLNYDLPWNPMILEQRIGRVQRLGSNFSNVIIFNLAVAGTTEDRIVARLASKLTEISESVGDIESILQAAGGGKSESFEEQIRQLVTLSLRNQDVEGKRRLAEESIVAAKKQLEEHEQEIDLQLGDLDALHTTGIRPPDLSVTTPDRSLRDFVLMALREEGCSIEDRGDLGVDVAAMTSPKEDRQTLVTFDRDTWRNLRASAARGFLRVDLYQHGQPAFERLLQRWLNKGQSFVFDQTLDDESLARAAAVAWVTRCRGGSIASIQIKRTLLFFDGTILAMCRASNGVDRYEKLVSCRISEPEHKVAVADLQKIDGVPIVEWTATSQTKPHVQQVIQRDDDLKAFSQFYKARLAEELPRVGKSPILRRKVLDDFEVSQDATIVGATGVKYSVCHCRLSIRVDGHAGYECRLVLVPFSGQIVEEPESWGRCEQTGASYPLDFLESCVVSGMQVLRHLLIASDESGRKALPEHIETCQRTGRRALNEEFAESSHSGQRAVISEFTKSEVSDRLYFAEELADCDFTGAKVGEDETAVSDLSGRRFRLDQVATCSFTNRRGHQSEFSKCEESGRPLTEDSLVASDVSGKLVHPDLLVASERPPYRKGLNGEMSRCEQTEKNLLVDEVAKCSLSDKSVDDSLLQDCEESGKPILAELLERCAETNRLVSPAELVNCSITNKQMLRRLCGQSPVSGHYGRSELLVTCEFTGASVLPDQLRMSEHSNKCFRSDQGVESSVSGRIAHKSEIEVCQYTQRNLLPDEVGVSDVTDKQTAKLELVTSETSGRRGRPEESVECSVTQKTLLRDEVATSTVSGLIAEKSLFQPSGVTGRLALANELLDCEVSGVKLLPDESAISSVSGRIALKSEIEVCDYTQRNLLPDEVGVSDVTGKQTAKLELVTSETSGRRGRPEESVECSVTQKTLLRDEVATSTVSGLIAEKSLFQPSGVTGRLALANELLDCEVSGVKLLPDESAISSVSNKRVDARLLVKSELSESRGLPDELVTCVVSGYRCVPADGQRCDETGEWTSRPQLVVCAVSNKTVRRDMCVASDISDRELLQSLARRSFKSEKWLHPDEAVPCHWHARWLARREEAICRRCELTFDRRLIVDGEFRYFRELMTRQRVGEDGSRFLEQLKSVPAIKRTSRAFFIRSRPKSSILFFRLHVETRFKMGVYDVGVVAKVSKGGVLKILSPFTEQIKKTETWKRVK